MFSIQSEIGHRRRTVTLGRCITMGLPKRICPLRRSAARPRTRDHSNPGCMPRKTVTRALRHQGALLVLARAFTQCSATQDPALAPVRRVSSTIIRHGSSTSQSLRRCRRFRSRDTGRTPLLPAPPRPARADSSRSQRLPSRSPTLAAACPPTLFLISTRATQSRQRTPTAKSSPPLNQRKIRVPTRLARRKHAAMQMSANQVCTSVRRSRRSRA